MGRQTLLKGAQFKYIKGGMYVLSLLVAILGLSLGGVGIWIRMDFKAKTYKDIIDPVFKLCEEVDSKFDFSINEHMDAIAYFLIFLGVGILGIGLVGTCATARERQTFLGLFSLLLFIIFAILLTAGIQAMVKKDVFVECEKSLTEHLQKSVSNYYTNATSKHFMDQVQKNTCDSVIKTFFGSITSNMIMILVVSFCLGLFTVVGIGMSSYLFTSLRKAKNKM